MKKAFLFLFFISTLTVFSQNEPGSIFNYKATFEGVRDATKAAPIITALKMVFKTPATFNDATSMIEFSSKMSISQTVFNHMMAGEGFQMETFERQEIKPEVPLEIKKMAVDTLSKKTIVAIKKETAKNMSPKQK